MSVSPIPLHQCHHCQKDLTESDSPIKESEILVTACFHAYHPKCLGQWIPTSQKNCPVCREPIYQHKAGKDFIVIWRIFLQALQLYPAIVLETLQGSTHQQEHCTACLEEFTTIPLRFDPEQNLLCHESCCINPHKTFPLTLGDISQVAQKCAKIDLNLAKRLTPSPPSFYQRVRRDHPHLLKVAIGATISGCALFINTLQYKDQNKILFFMGLPALIVVKTLQQVGLIILKLLDQPN